MVSVERTNDEIVIRIPGSWDPTDIERILRFLSYKEIVKESQAEQKAIDDLANEVKSGWWERNKDRFPEIN